MTEGLIKKSPLPPFNKGGLKGFTLAEVLITLGIIGIVAAITLPPLVNKTNKKELHVQLKKTYSELGQINQKFIADFDMNMCQYEWNNIQYTDVDYSGKALPKQFSKYLYKGAEGIGLQNHYYFANLNGKKLTNFTLFDDGYYLDGNGKNYYFEYSREITHKCPIITVDINGFNKPNRIGYDIFMFRPTIDGRVIGMGEETKKDDSIVDFGGINKIDNTEQYCNFNIDTDSNGFGCAYYALLDRHPFDNSKSYWKDFIK